MNYCVGFIFNKNIDKVLLVKKNPRDLSNKELSSFLKGKLNGIGGKLDGDELSVEAITRECLEETNLVIPIEKWNKFCVIETKAGLVYFYYTVSDDIYNYKQTENHEELKIYSLYFDSEDRLNTFYQNHLRMPNLDWLIPMALNHYNKLDNVSFFDITEVY